jgi:hypothetical protein
MGCVLDGVTEPTTSWGPPGRGLTGTNPRRHEFDDLIVCPTQYSPVRPGSDSAVGEKRETSAERSSRVIVAMPSPGTPSP